MSPSTPPERRHRVTRLGIPEIAALLDLPEGVRIHHLIPTHNPDGIMMVLESEDFDPVPHDAAAPYDMRTMRYTRVDDDGTRWSRWVVQG